MFPRCIVRANGPRWRACFEGERFASFEWIALWSSSERAMQNERIKKREAIRNTTQGGRERVQHGNSPTHAVREGQLAGGNGEEREREGERKDTIG